MKKLLGLLALTVAVSAVASAVVSEVEAVVSLVWVAATSCVWVVSWVLAISANAEEGTKESASTKDIAVLAPLPAKFLFFLSISTPNK